MGVVDWIPLPHVPKLLSVAWKFPLLHQEVDKAPLVACTAQELSPLLDVVASCNVLIL